jgi:hypothetical protein
MSKFLGFGGKAYLSGARERVIGSAARSSSDQGDIVKNNCGGCFYYLSGCCHRNPPQVTSTNTGTWPLVRLGNWCGEFTRTYPQEVVEHYLELRGQG